LKFQKQQGCTMWDPMVLDRCPIHGPCQSEQRRHENMRKVLTPHNCEYKVAGSNCTTQKLSFDDHPGRDLFRVWRDCPFLKRSPIFLMHLIFNELVPMGWQEVT